MFKSSHFSNGNGVFGARSHPYSATAQMLKGMRKVENANGGQNPDSVRRTVQRRCARRKRERRENKPSNAE